jgi:hypothetical protein
VRHRALWRLLLPFVVVAAATIQAAAQDITSAEGFLRKLYNGYLTGQPAPNPTGRAAGELFTTALLALIRADQALAAGELGVLQRDPICACQDYDRLEQLKISMEPAGPTQARGTVSFVNSGTPTTVQYRLVEQDGRWRIGDIAEPGIPSLRHFLADGIASLAQERAE